MRVFCENKHIKIKRDKGIVLVLEDFTDVQQNIYKYFKSETNRLQIPLKVGLLGYPDEINEQNFENLCDKSKNKVKFIAPLIEEFFQKLKDKEYNLVIFFVDKIYDLNDFQEELSAKFDKVIIKKVENHFNPREIFTDSSENIFDLDLTGIKIYPLASAVPYEWDEELTADIEKNKIYLKLKDSNLRQALKLDLFVVFRSYHDKIPIKIETSLQEYQIEIECDTRFINPNWKELSQDESELFSNHIQKYLSGEKTKLFCPLCICEHYFHMAFVCKKQKGDILHGTFSTGKIIFKSIGNILTKNFLFQIRNDKVRFLPINRNVFEFEEMNFIFETHQKELYKIVGDKDSYKATPLLKIFSNNLYQLSKNEFFYRVI